ncbi:MAG TPA: hypothetical protein VME18_08900 [Acidobacteriaceae bacterium]|nr:hypothetical protein [Acidobacteriaceae bacterium]
MKRAQTGKRKLVLLVIVVGVLAASVFAWGTEYKISLYPTRHHESRDPVPFAKLLSEKERPAAGHCVDVCMTVQTSAAAMMLLVLVPAVPDSRSAREVWILRLQAHSAARPIPCLS